MGTSVGDMRTRELSVINQGNQPMPVVLEVEDEAGVFGFLVEGQRVRRLALNVAAKQRVVVTVFFAPTAAQRFEGKVNIFAGMTLIESRPLTASGTE